MRGSISERIDKVIVEVRVVFLKIGEIDTLKEFYQADAFVQVKWREPRLDKKSAGELATAELDRYWNPACYIDNILSETKEVQWLTAQVSQNGEVYIVERRRIKGVFLETLELNDFPLDVQDLTITVTTERSDVEVDLIPDHNELSAINKQTFVDQQEWKLHEHVEITKRVLMQEYTCSMKIHPCISVTCRAARRPGYFYWNVFLIMFMISGLSFATFAVSPDKAELRLRLSFTLILTSVTFKYVITQNLPRISYLTYMDKYVLMSLAILCIISIWHAVITVLPFNAIDVYSASNLTKSSILPTNSSSAEEPHSNSTLSINRINTNEDLHAFQPGLSGYEKRTSGDYSNDGKMSRTLKYFDVDRKMKFDVLPITEEMLSLYFLGLLQAYADSRIRSMKLLEVSTSVSQERLKSMKWLEKHVFISFVVLYIVAHSIFVFWLYFGASKRRREMNRKDKEYRRCRYSKDLNPMKKDLKEPQY